MNTKKEIEAISQTLTAIAQSCEISATQVEGALEQLEKTVIRLRAVKEMKNTILNEATAKPPAPIIPNCVGEVEVTKDGWLHIKINTLLPASKYKTPVWLTDTLSKLLLDYQEKGRKLPKFDSALLVIDEHCSIENRQVFDHDNKGWKAIPNALKGIIIEDDDQFTMDIALLAENSLELCCHIWVVPKHQAVDFFMLKGYGFDCCFLR